jgi:3'-phosphoadenosine 5'-phosphosulfate sulfotransferase (PAPS reductase)/FAD synthetase
MKPKHYVSISGGKDSTAVACIALERAEKHDMDLDYLFADTGNEHELTLEHVDYLGRALGIRIETVRADFTDRFAARREAIARDWPKPLPRTQHTKACKARRDALPPASRGCRPSPERSAALRDWLDRCDCPVKISPPIPPDLIARAVALMVPTGNPFLDMAMLHGRFPGSKSRFCTTELKMEPMERVKEVVRLAGRPIVEWIGERAEESKARAKKPIIERERYPTGADAILYRPIHALSAAQVFAIAKRHGLKPNPLYLMGMSRVGCMPCIMCQKEELREIARRFPEHIERIAQWELICGGVARHAYSALVRGERQLLVSSFLPTDKLPPDQHGLTRSTIHRAVEWSQTGRGGRNFDLLNAIDDLDAADEPDRCSSRYGLCE